MLQEGLLEDLSEHIDSMAASSHYFVIDPSETAIIGKNMGSVSFYTVRSTVEPPNNGHVVLSIIRRLSFLRRF